METRDVSHIKGIQDWNWGDWLEQPPQPWFNPA